jgi:Plasmid pRiA4b ORF-3-like protein
MTFQLLVELDGVTPTVWRRILVPTGVKMSKLHDILQSAMGWTDSHMHSFTVGDVSYGMCFEDSEEDEIDEETVTVLQVLRGHERFTYDYDFGDGWEHTITVETEFKNSRPLKFAICLAGENACPPEDSGGPTRFQYFLSALADPQHEEHDNHARWNGGETFDRTAFDLLEVNAALQRLPQHPRRTD